MVKKKTEKTQGDPWIGNLTRWDGRFQGGVFLNGTTGTPLAQRTPRTEADNVLKWVTAILNYSGVDESGETFALMMSVVTKNGVTGDDCLRLLKAAEESANYQGKPTEDGLRHVTLAISLMSVACAYAKQAHEEQSNSNLAWSYANEANRWLGVLQGFTSGGDLGKSLGMRRKAKAGADAKNFENRAMKSEVFAWCDANMPAGRSMKSVAAEISKRIMPVKPDTAYEWVREWKKARSAGTP
jgi:hypothetical protein